MRDTLSLLDVDHILHPEFPMSELQTDFGAFDEMMFDGMSATGMSEKVETDSLGAAMKMTDGNATALTMSSDDPRGQYTSPGMSNPTIVTLSPVSASGSSNNSEQGEEDEQLRRSLSRSTVRRVQEDATSPSSTVSLPAVPEHYSRPSLPPLSTSFSYRNPLDPTAVSASDVTSSTGHPFASQHLHPQSHAGAYNGYRRASLPTLLHQSPHLNTLNQPFASPHGWQQPYGQASAYTQHQNQFLEPSVSTPSSATTSSSSRTAFSPLFNVPPSASDHFVGSASGSAGSSFLPPRSVSPPPFTPPTNEYAHSSASGYSATNPHAPASRPGSMGNSFDSKYHHHISQTHPAMSSSSSSSIPSSLYALRRPSADDAIHANSSSSAFLNMRSWPSSPEHHRQQPVSGSDNIFSLSGNSLQTSDWTPAPVTSTSEETLHGPQLTVSPTSRPGSGLSVKEQHQHQSSVSPSKTLTTSKSEPIISTVPPPIKRRGKLPKSTTDLLKTWLHEHADHPYPSEDEKKSLCGQTGLTMNQVSNWMINARRRILAPAKQNQAANISPATYRTPIQHTYPNTSAFNNQLAGRPMLPRSSGTMGSLTTAPNYAYANPSASASYPTHPSTLPGLSLYSPHGDMHSSTGATSSYSYGVSSGGGAPLNYQPSTLSTDPLSRTLLDSRNAYMSLPRRGLSTSLPPSSQGTGGAFGMNGNPTISLPAPQQSQQTQRSTLPLPASLAQQMQGLPHFTDMGPVLPSSGSNRASPDHPFAYAPDMNETYGGGAQGHLTQSRSPSVVQSVGTAGESS